MVLYPGMSTASTEWCCTLACVQQVVKQMADVGGSKLDEYEIEADGESIYTLQDLTEFQLAAVRQSPAS
jgi:hypothetical protein